MIGSVLAWFGSISYELYLSHSIAYDYFQENPFGRTIFVYLIVSISTLIVIVLFERKIVNKDKARKTGRLVGTFIRIVYRRKG